MAYFLTEKRFFRSPLAKGLPSGLPKCSSACILPSSSWPCRIQRCECPYPIESVATKRSHQKRGGETIGRWYRRYFGSSRRDERRSHAHGGLAAQHVRLLVEELDGDGRVINSWELEVLGEVPADGRSYFCVPEPVGASTYRLSVTGAESMYTRGQ
jgi:hypothetical protein